MEIMPKILIVIFLLHKKNGNMIIMQIAKSFVFQRNPVGGLIPLYKKMLSVLDKFIGSFPKKFEIVEYEEIGILKSEKDSINEIAISKKTNTESKLNILFNLSRFVETARIFNVRKKPQNM